MSLGVTDLRVYYRTLAGDVKALDGVTFDIADGEIMGLAGESGCGKSTLGNSLVRLDGRMKLVSGEVRLDDSVLPIADLEAMQEWRWKEISVIPQFAMSALNPTRKVGRIVDEMLRARGLRYRDFEPELIRRLELVGLGREQLDRYPIELSGGMKQRAVMVISTLLDPSLLIADEVTSALDVSSQRAVAQTLASFRDHGFVRSMIVVTHDVSILYQIADTLAIMYAGRLAEKAPTDIVMRESRHPYTKLLIGALPEVGVRYHDERLVGIPGTPPSLLNPPTGCRFRDRCPVAFEACVEEPPMVAVDRGHHVACWAVTPDGATVPAVSSAASSSRVAVASAEFAAPADPTAPSDPPVLTGPEAGGPA